MPLSGEMVFFAIFLVVIVAVLLFVVKLMRDVSNTKKNIEELRARIESDRE